MGHFRSESQLPLYSAQTASSSSSSLSLGGSSNSSSSNNAFDGSSSEKKAYQDHNKSWHKTYPDISPSSNRSNIRSKLEYAFSLFPAALAAINARMLGGGRRRPLPLLCFCLVSLLVLASLTTSEEYIPDSVSASRAKLSSFIEGFRRPIKLPKAPPTSDITLNDSGRQEEWVSPTPPLPLTATLRERLEALWNAPLGEPANWVKWNSQTCSRERVKQAQNDWITQDAALIWHSLNSTDVKRYRKGMIDYLVECEKQGLMDPANVGEGRGLVFTAGNADTFSRVLLTLKILRNHYNTSLPAEIFSFPGEMPPPELLDEFVKYNATLRVIEHASRDESRAKNYQIKSDAIVASSFAEVLYLDSDNIPVAYLGEHDGTWSSNVTTERELIWNAPSYKRLGVMFWPDYWKTGPMNPIWGIIGTQCRDEWEQEAGQILIDKRRHMDALLLANWMLDDWQFWFHISDGDKDIFRFAFLALRKRWAVPGRYVGAGALPGNTLSGFCGHTMMQHDHLGNPMFVHYNLLKQIPSGVGRGYTWGRTRQTVLFNGGRPEAEGGEGSGDVEADMIANAAADGTAILPAPAGVRYRAALERGLYTRFHGGVTSALCVDIHYEDPRTSVEREKDLAYEKKHPIFDDKKVKQEPKGHITHGKTKKGDEIAINWELDPLYVNWWKDEPRLANFEKAFYEEGGKPNGKGF
ncbi:glycosyltransferase family 71 protein [Cystobasidium minutum MCA 4210]|uniref:glycosyltransferase family 71 protein n=1 Tax=Cystobasidium minutum MCA 4210 TaxID=1397322 RepID=UPI0034CE6BDC|eukprot:jgi/Rhomi1/190873/estExt_fgenesh1_pg.C_60172